MHTGLRRGELLDFVDRSTRQLFRTVCDASDLGGSPRRISRVPTRTEYAASALHGRARYCPYCWRALMPPLWYRSVVRYLQDRGASCANGGLKYLLPHRLTIVYDYNPVAFRSSIEPNCDDIFANRSSGLNMPIRYRVPRLANG